MPRIPLRERRRLKLEAYQKAMAPPELTVEEEVKEPVEEEKPKRRRRIRRKSTKS